MNLSSMPVLALLLFAPWFLVLSGLYWWYPRQPRGGARRVYDAAALLLSLAAFVATLLWAHGYADRQHGQMWPQVLATSAGYGVYLLVLGAAFFLRRAWLRRR
jgi:hypothetical protein